MSENQGLPPVERTFTLDSPPEKAYASLVEQTGKWWPNDFSASGAELADVTIEQEPGGRVFETSGSGDQVPWGSVMEVEPGRRILMAWGLGLGGRATTEVEVVFAGAPGGGSAVTFEHRGWRADQQHDRAKFDDPGGWDVILEDFREYTGR
jgi:uncharacterized protein YndB with AHSA1/START domain